MSKHDAWKLTDERDRALVASLAEMHTWTRPAGTWADDRFRELYLYPLEAIANGFVVDRTGNIHVTVGSDDSPILFSSHTDTVHERPGQQRVTVDRDGVLRLAGRSKYRQDCLGADDTVGVWLMVEMIRAHVAGHYVFHFGEEVGTIGSNGIKDEMVDFLQTFKAAIAFDRKDTTDVITHQCGARTCSDAFAIGLSAALNQTPGLVYRPSPFGLYTDTERYADVVPECTNVSVGYYRQHSANEYVDVEHVLRLRRALLAVDWTTLPIVRDPSVREYARTERRWYNPRSFEPVVVDGEYVNADQPFDDGDVDAPRDDDGKPLSSVDLIRRCEACDLEYWTSESNARYKYRFCDRMCEAFKLGGIHAI